MAFACLWAFVDELVRRGLEHACVSPGSRSTPIALALQRHPKVAVHVHLDERASAYFALGLAKATGRPVAVGCTSGTAVANLFPAVVEASMARVPLVLLTADRPPELRGVGANQTIDQLEIFGRHVRVFVDAPVPGDRPDPEGWRELAFAAVSEALRHPPGPVHVNLPFREPLVPEVAETPAEPTELRWAHSIASSASEDQVERLAGMLSSVERGVIVAGTLREEAPALVRLARALQWPLIAEPTSGVRVPGALGAGQFLLADDRFASSHVPDLVVQAGAAPTSRAGLAFVARAADLVIVDPDGLVADPNRRATWTLSVDVQTLALEVADRLAGRERSAWVDEWEMADRSARASVDELIDGWDEPFEGRIARDVAAWLPHGTTLVVGSSMPIRDLDAYMRPRTGIRVLANRGASGIDGFVSTALGVAGSGVRTVALCGDLTLLHDAGSLLWSARRALDAVFVVPNNDGGAIFSFLDQARLPELETLFTTPHGLDLAAVAAAAGAGHARVDRSGELFPALERASASGGVWILEVPSDRERNVDRHREVSEAVSRALARI